MVRQKGENHNAQLKNDHRQDSWMKSWWTNNGRTRRRPYGIIKLNILVTGDEGAKPAHDRIV